MARRDFLFLMIIINCDTINQFEVHPSTSHLVTLPSLVVVCGVNL